MKVRTIKLRHVESFYRRLESNLAPASIRHVHGVLRQILDYARRARYITDNPADDVQGLPEVNTWTVDAPTIEEVNAFLAGVRDLAGEMWWVFTVLVASTGIRRGEACALQWADIDLEGCEVRIRRAAIDIHGRGKLIKDYPKTRGSIRTIKIDPQVAEILALQCDRLEKARAEADATKPVSQCFVFSPHPLGDDFFAPYSASQMFRRVRLKLEENGVRCHRLRHFSATQAVLHGVPITEVMGRHGWTSYQTAMKYQHYTGARDDEAARAVASVLNLRDGNSDRT